MKDLRFSFVIPCYRSERTISGVVEEISLETEKLGIAEYEIILVNDGSPDNAWEVIKDLSSINNRIRGFSLSKNFGQHAALLAGYSNAAGDIIVSLDDDGQTPIDELGSLIDELEKGYDVVYAYYDKVKQNAFRRLTSGIAHKVSEVMLEIPKGVRDSSFFIMRRFILDEVLNYKNPYPNLEGLIFGTTKNVSCVMTHHRERADGRSGYSLGKLMALFMNGLTSFSVKPLRIGTIAGGIITVSGFIYALSLIILKLSIPETQIGWTVLIPIILIVGGLILLMLGLIGEYIGRIYICMNHPPQYVIREKTDSLPGRARGIKYDKHKKR